MSETLYCQKCQIPVSDPMIERKELPGGKYHLKASCPECGRYLKFLPTGEPPSIYFGKYKGSLVVEVVAKDPEYCRWLIQQDWLKPKLKSEIENALAVL